MIPGFTFKLFELFSLFLKTVKLPLSKQQNAVALFLGSTISLVYGILGLYIQHPPLSEMLKTFYVLKREYESNILPKLPQTLCGQILKSYHTKTAGE